MMRGIFLSGLMMLLTTVVFAQDKRAMTPIDVASIEQVGSAVLSEDGEYIAYTMIVQADPLKENLPASSHLYLYDVSEGSSMSFLTRASVRGVAFRPGHNSLTFLGRLDGAKTTRIYEIPLTGGEAKELHSHESSIGSYQWNADGSKLFFVSGELSTTEKSDLPYQPEIYEGELRYNRGWTASPGGDAKMLSVDGNVEGGQWNHDGSKILMSISSTPLVDDHYMKQQLHIYDVAAGNISASIDHAGKMGEYIWSPDGSQLAFIAGADINDPVAGRLFVASVDGGAPTQLYPGWMGAFENIEWLRNGEINYLGSKGAESVYGTINPKGSSIKEAPGEGLAIASLDANEDGSMCMVGTTASHPRELFYKKGNDVKRLTNSNEWLDDIAMGKQEVVSYKAADGLEIEGILIYPSDYNEGTRYPLLVSVHGGPEAHIDNGWITAYSMPGQVAAGKGYAIFYPNYRGSTGRGLEYTLTSQGDAAGKEFDDIVDGVKHLVSIGLVDEDKVGVTGGSYGGYATAWLSSRYTEHFAAGVMFVGISDKVSKWGTTDIPNEEYLVHARKWVYEDYDFFLKRSPVYYAGDCKTPLLIMHGKEDPRVHPSQSMEMYRHVKSRTDTPVELIFYPGEGHGNRRSTARYDYNLRMLGWFDQYVMGNDKS